MLIMVLSSIALFISISSALCAVWHARVSDRKYQEMIKEEDRILYAGVIKNV